jgi:hypothetical protein
MYVPPISKTIAGNSALLVDIGILLALEKGELNIHHFER